MNKVCPCLVVSDDVQYENHHPDHVFAFLPASSEMQCLHDSPPLYDQQEGELHAM
jgi:hypothetical protein